MNFAALHPLEQQELASLSSEAIISFGVSTKKKHFSQCDPPRIRSCKICSFQIKRNQSMTFYVYLSDYRLQN